MDKSWRRLVKFWSGSESEWWTDRVVGDKDDRRDGK